MWNEKKLDLPVTPIERVANLVGIVAFTAMITMLVLQWNQLPETIPAHFGLKGEVDRWGSKIELLILPLIGFALYALLHVLEKHPHTHNYPARLNDANREIFYVHSRRVLNLMKNVCVLLFTYTTWRTILIAKGTASDLGMVPFSLLLIALFAIVIWGAIGMSRIR
ncbi:MAG: DUF1648 domain-containing protein [Solibacillus sp.]